MVYVNWALRMRDVCLGTLLDELLADPKAPAYISLIAVFLVMLIVILAVSWKDSKAPPVKLGKSSIGEKWNKCWRVWAVASF